MTMCTSDHFIINLYSYLIDDESGQADALVNEPNSVSKQMLPAHVREMHRNRDEGFETEFGVRTSICHLNNSMRLLLY